MMTTQDRKDALNNQDLDLVTRILDGSMPLIRWWVIFIITLCIVGIILYCLMVVTIFNSADMIGYGTLLYQFGFILVAPFVIISIYNIGYVADPNEEKLPEAVKYAILGSAIAMIFLVCPFLSWYCVRTILTWAQCPEVISGRIVPIRTGTDLVGIESANICTGITFTRFWVTNIVSYMLLFDAVVVMLSLFWLAKRYHPVKVSALRKFQLFKYGQMKTGSEAAEIGTFVDGLDDTYIYHGAHPHHAYMNDADFAKMVNTELGTNYQKSDAHFAKPDRSSGARQASKPQSTSSKPKK
jgi:hypothetical protein